MPANGGSVRIETIASEALHDNPLHDPALRRVAVWLPPSYATATERRYPVIYWLAGFTGTGEMMFQSTPWQPGLGERLGRLFSRGAGGGGGGVAPRGLPPPGGGH